MSAGENKAKVLNLLNEVFAKRNAAGFQQVLNLAGTGCSSGAP